MSKTIRGESIDVILSNLKEKEAPSTFEMAIRNFDDILGPHYKISYEDLSIIKAGDTDNASVKCVITLLDDDFGQLFSRDFYYTNEINYEDGGKKPIHLGNAIARAQKNAFQHCALFFFKEETTGDSIKKNNATKPNNKGQQKNGHCKSNNDVIHLKITSVFEPLKNYNGSFFASALTKNNETVRVVCWHGVVKALTEQGKWDAIVAKLPSEDYVSVKATKGFYNNMVQFAIQEFF